jgi:hypothetical protein
MAFTGLRWGETVGLQASYIRGPDRRRNHSYIRVEWQMIELNGKFYLAPPKEGSWRDVDIPPWLFDLLQRLKAQARRCRYRRRDDGASACGSRGAFLFLGPGDGHARRSNYATRVFHPRRRWRLPGGKTPPRLPHRALAGALLTRAVPRHPGADQVAECSWAALVPGLTPHGLRHGHQTAMRRDRVPRVLRRDRLRHGPSGRHRRPLRPHRRRDDRGNAGPADAAMAGRCRGAGAHRPGPRRRAALGRARSGRVAGPVPGTRGRNPAPIGWIRRVTVSDFAWWAQLGSNQRPLACKEWQVSRSSCLICWSGCPWASVADRCTPPLMAR